MAEGLATRFSRKTWRIDGGKDLDGDDLTVIVLFEDGVVVVTVF